MGTSLPELVTVVQSARRGETDLIVGNLLGWCLFNALAVAGVAGLISPTVIGSAGMVTTVLVATGLGLAAMVMMRSGHLASRTEGSCSSPPTWLPSRSSAERGAGWCRPRRPRPPGGGRPRPPGP
ncbi:MAG: hypothetical protein ACK5PP_08060 [Acidimicrobiales bacterium]